jgi:fatty-acyl-CoA synthase
LTDPNTAATKTARAAWLRALERTAAIERDVTLTLPVLIDGLADRFGTAPALASSTEHFSYAGLAARSHQYARWGIARGFGPRDVVALLMGNCAEYVAVWLGLTRLGVTVALINTQLTGDALVHSISIAAPRALIVGADLVPAVAAVHVRLPGVAIVVRGAVAGFDALDAALASLSGAPLPGGECELPKIDATALYIYTSGTTGLPKAAKVTHYRLMRWSQWFAGLMDARSTDRLYNCLPLYHSVGGVVAIGAMLVGGGAVVIRPRFSVSDFWRDVTDEGCTVFQYIGELCRYLVNAPEHPQERAHSLRLACGNGLRPEVWERFRERFAIPHILEYYASTEGNFSLYNCEEQPGAIGRIPSFLSHRLQVELLRFDWDAGEPHRDETGLCRRCAVDEVGEAVGLIPGDGARAGRFEGYTDAGANDGKLLRNVFEAGDTWYRTGDLMRRDAAGFYYFVDRVGDTYRWKGENVATAEVLSTLSSVPGILEGVVFGVAVPGFDGRAGLAALVVDERFDLKAFRDAVENRLPLYARPVFLRLLPALDATGTFKPRKQALLREGCDPRVIADELYVRDARTGGYEKLDAARYGSIVTGGTRL